VWAASSGASGEHNNFFTFDANGNILTQQRYEGSTLVDDLSYQYATNSAGHLLSNRLYSVDDAVTIASLSATDMEDMPAYINGTPNTSNNYTYTQIGELKSDAQEEISEIHWRVDSKISEITRTSGSSKKNLKFEYDAMGNRVAKHVYAGSVLESSTYYVRDAQGNVMGVYEHKMDAENAVMEYKLIERNIYGSAQVGICKDTVDLNITNAAGALTQATYYHARQLNHRQYSLSNHLGNVLTTIGDGKAATDSNSDGVIDYYTAYIISVSDYSPFGVELANRSWSIEEYRNGFNGKEKVNEITGNSSDYDFGARIYDARIGRWLRRDAHEAKYPGESPYSFALNSPIMANDPDGNDAIVSINGNTITIKTQIFIYGEKATSEMARNIQKGIMQSWGKDFKYNNYTVKFEVEVLNVNIRQGETSDAADQSNNKNRWNGDENWVEIIDESLQEYRSNVSGMGQNGCWGSNEDAKTYAHEFGHFLGLDDAYIVVKANPSVAAAFGLSTKEKNKENNIKLGSASEDEIMAMGNKVTQRDIDAIAQNAIGTINSGKSEMEAKGMPLNKPTSEDLREYSGSGQYVFLKTE
jgi:RHS repeat-associated protein